MVLNAAITTAPGKIILSGEHAVVYGTEAIACAIDIRTTCTARVLPNRRQLKISLGGVSTERVWCIDDVNEAVDEDGENVCWEKLVKLVGLGDRVETLGVQVVLSLYLLIVARHFKGPGTSGLAITLTTELPIGSGLGSSASMGVALASCFLVLCENVREEREKWTEEEVDLVNKYAYAAEEVVHGAPSGIDNMTITSGHFLSFKGGHISLLPELEEARINVLIVNTKRPRSTKILVEKVKKQKERFPQLYSSIFRSIGNVTESLKEALKKTRTTTTTTTTTNAKTVPSPVTINEDDVIDDVISEVEQLCDMNQSLLDCIGVGHDDISKILHVCRGYGLHGKLTGAGGGGCVFVVLPQRYHNDVVNEVVQQLTNLGYQCYRTLLGTEGVQVLK